MAITKIWPVKSRLDTSLRYIGNPEKTSLRFDMEAMEGVVRYIENDDKTENCVYVEAFNCSKENAFNTMIKTQERFGKRNRKNGVLAYHLVQSFKDFETTPETAHQCGVELVNKLFSDRYETVLATHLDKDNLHNHIIINAVSFIDGKKYRRNFKDYFIDIRKTSDEICRNHCLTVIDKPKNRGMQYAEWKAFNEDKPTIRGQVREELDEIIKSSYTMKDFWRILKEREYVVHRRGENIKYTSVIPPFGKRPVRLDNLGEQYTEKAIFERIKTARNGIRTASPTELPKKKYRYKGSFQNIKHKKLKGFQALYFSYLYLFKKIRRKQTPQRVSFFMREELIKLERYQKQFRYIFSHDIETGEQLQLLQKSQENRIDELVIQRKNLYAERNDENCGQVKEKAAEINKELQNLRTDVKMCKAIFKDAYSIAEKKLQAKELQKQAYREMIKDEHKRRSR